LDPGWNNDRNNSAEEGFSLFVLVALVKCTTHVSESAMEQGDHRLAPLGRRLDDHIVELINVQILGRFWHVMTLMFVSPTIVAWNKHQGQQWNTPTPRR
jgi:hypothetical protein